MLTAQRNSLLIISVGLIFMVHITGTVSQPFSVQPESVVQAEGFEAVFECLYPGALIHLWKINGEHLFADRFPADFTRIGASTDSPARLIILATSQNNNTNVQCEATIRNGSDTLPRRELSTMANLTVIGISSTVMNLADSISVSWTSFPTPLTYCVEVNQTVLGSTETVKLDPVCGLNGTQYPFSYPNHSVCDRFSFTVTPTEGGRRGTSSQPVTGFFTQARGTGGLVFVAQGENRQRKDVRFEATVPSCTRFTYFQLESIASVLPTGGSIVEQSNGSVSITYSLPTDITTKVTVTLTDVDEVHLKFENVSISTVEHRYITQGDDQSMKLVTFKLGVPICPSNTTFLLQSDYTPDVAMNCDVERHSLAITFFLSTDIITMFTITLTDVYGVDLVFENLLINTNDVQDIIINELPERGGINLTVVFAGGSLSPGALVCVVPILTDGSDGSLDFNNITLTTIPQNKNASSEHIYVPTGSYKILVYDIESNFLPNMPTSIPAVIKTVDVNGTKYSHSKALSTVEPINVTLAGSYVEVVCPGVNLNCLVLVHFMNSLDKMNVTFINYTDGNRSRAVMLSGFSESLGVSVVVWTWGSKESIFDGVVSYRSQFLYNLIATAATTSTPTDSSDPPNQGLSLPFAWIVICFFILLFLVLGIVFTVHSLRIRKKKIRKAKLNGKRNESNSSERSSHMYRATNLHSKASKESRKPVPESEPPSIVEDSPAQHQHHSLPDTNTMQTSMEEEVMDSLRVGEKPTNKQESITPSWGTE